MAKRPKIRGVRSSIDTGRLAAAASRPGIDPRIWLTRAVVKDVAFDPDQGLFADIQFQPDGAIETALVGAAMAGDDFGSYWPLHVDDIVLVALSMGDPADGPVIIARLWSGSEKPPIQLSKDDLGVDGGDVTSDPTTRLEDGTTLRIVGKKGASYKIELDGNATFEIVGTGGTTVLIDGDAGVRLGKPVLPDTFRGVARLNDQISATGTPPVVDPPSDPPPPPAVPFLVWAANVVTACAAIPFVVPPLDPTIGTISSASSKVKAE